MDIVGWVLLTNLTIGLATSLWAYRYRLDPEDLRDWPTAVFLVGLSLSGVFWLGFIFAAERADRIEYAERKAYWEQPGNEDEDENTRVPGES